MNDSIQNLENNYLNCNKITELIHVLEKDDQFFTEVMRDDEVSEDQEFQQLIVEEEKHDVRLGFITGVVNREVFNTFERVLFRATRGILYMKYSEIEEEIRDPKLGKDIKKNVFIIFYQGEELGKKISKLCESFGTVYPCSENRNDRKDVLEKIKTNLNDLQMIIRRTKEHKKKLLTEIANNIETWKLKVLKEKAIHHTMNLFRFDSGNKCLIAEGWVPKEKLNDLHQALRSSAERSRCHIPSHCNEKFTTETPPTYFPVNKFTEVFQSIINAYGVPRYREINPAAFTIVTFPFMFGVMFGDVGHGALLLIATLLILTREKAWKGKKLHDLIQPAYDGRYVLLLMSLFSIYCGFIYNEVFAVPMNLFGSNWELLPGHKTYTLKSHTRTYEFGVDPVWKGAGNELMFYNSLKMKMSIIMGVIHMLLGLIMKFINSIYTRNDLDIFFECIPGTTLMLSLFGYMCFLMFYKWNIPYYYNELNGLSPVRKDAPNILTMMIYMFLSPFKNAPGITPLFPSQGIIQGFLVILAVASVPLMLIPKPFILKRRHERREHIDGDEEFEFSEVMVHQTIETIEFALGSISSTASYLRLWALSLAHSELSSVFWNLAFIQLGLNVGPFIVTFIVFAVWAGATVGIILVMETLSAFLHSLRLHWVEFQGRFYKADGVLFCPFSYETIFSGEEENQ